MMDPRTTNKSTAAHTIEADVGCFLSLLSPIMSRTPCVDTFLNPWDGSRITIAIQMIVGKISEAYLSLFDLVPQYDRVLDR